ncbi:NADH-quinone oxidoreductase subunit N [Buchnera aphidicola (Hyadaphis tataricae)]|uniref:NADH-quinone oxidoreductase subunit N n=1 Tax=Buchnera aphidicola (Hyadaphis tataricae) TaxID=1241859 RepID=A0A4D6XUH4_9GAMM|nr:NADH-quinone oxidoreductase subunit N [Buchnera aphidicola]QCI21482.1 NADH-quinone oxidoreductase subunit N [Buchnera aphidicola (Hyadaphis tataricae)]
MITNTQQLTVFLPFLIVMFGCLIVTLSISYNRNHAVISIFSISFLTFSFFSLSLMLTMTPINISNLFYIDSCSVLYIGMVIFASIATCIFSYPYLEKYKDNKEEFYLLILISTLGAMFSIIANHMSSLFISMELMSLPIFGLIAYFRHKKHALEAAFKYIVLSVVASSFLLFGIAWIYSISGSLSFNNISKITNIASLNEKLVLFFGFFMILISLLFKLSIAPFHLWVPDIYHGTSSLALSFFSTVSKIVVFGVLLHFLYHLNILNNNKLYIIMMLIAFFSMLIGNIMALFQNNIKRFFGYCSISQMSYLLTVLFVSKENYALSLEASSIYLLSYLFSNIAFFGIMSLISSSKKIKDVNLISSYHGLFFSNPILSIILTLIFLSLSGFPMTLGFIGKFYILSIIIKEHFWTLGIAFLISSVIGFFCYLRIIMHLYLDTSKILLKNDVNMLDHWVITPSGIMILSSGIMLLIFGIYPTPLIYFIEYF